MKIVVGSVINNAPGSIMSTINSFSELKVGMIFRTPGLEVLHAFFLNRIVQIVKLNSDSSANYIYVVAGTKSCQSWLAFQSCTLLANHPLASVVCPECQQFCSQKCFKVNPCQI